MSKEALFPLTRDWEVTTLGEVAARGGGSIQTGPFGSQLHASDYVQHGIPSIMPQNITTDRISEDGIARITEEDAQRLSKYRVKVGDIVYSRRGDVERRALVRAENDGWLCGTGCLKVDLGRGVVIPEYAAFYLSHPASKAWVVQHAVGATMPNLNTSILSALPFVLPSLDEQEEIASALSALDDKIELNRRMNETLEEMARALFRDWFVDFGPTRRQIEGATNPVAIMGGALPVEKAAALAPLFPVAVDENGLPEGWSMGRVSDLANAVTNTVKPAEVSQETHYIGLEHMPRRSIALGVWETAEKVTSNKSAFEKGQILFGKLRPYFHKVGIAAVDGICSTDIVVVDALRPQLRPFVATLMSTDEFVSYTNQTSSGTRMPRTSWKLMRDYEVTRAPTALLTAFGEIVGPLHAKIHQSIHENLTLAQLRDLLLPKLMSGEVSLVETSRG